MCVANLDTALRGNGRCGKRQKCTIGSEKLHGFWLRYNQRWATAKISAVCPQPEQGVLTYMAIPATQMRPGMIIKHNDQLHLVFKVEHRTPGNLRAFIQAKLD